MNWRILLCLLPLVYGCNRDPARHYDHVIKAVQESESNLPGVSTEKALEVVLASLATEGFIVQPEGWTCLYHDKRYYVWYNLKVNEKPVKFHWLMEERKIYPGNELARTITRNIDK
jgi:hypothetical protein